MGAIFHKETDMTPLIAMFVFMNLPIIGGGRASEFEKTQSEVNAFERKLAAFPKEKEADRDQAIRVFFGQLKEATSAIKLAAIGMTCSRYVYVVPQKLRGEMMGPLLHDLDMRVRLRAAHSLGYNGLAGEHFESIVALLKQVDIEGLPHVIYAMSRSQDARFFPHLRDLLKHEDGTIRAEVVFELGYWHRDRDTIRAELKKLWDDPHPQVRYNLL